TFFLVSVIYQAAVFGRAGALVGFVIGITLAALILAGASYSGASLNPARTLGPALIAGEMSYVLPYFVGIFGGGLLAGMVQGRLIGRIQLQTPDNTA
ncbi:MAG TPA: aquaporin, partial [Acidimicrobiales bacterium]|nr:aquaporin [Acidimicrobiales bacterium]